MRVSSSTSVVALLCWLLALSASVALSADSGVTINNAETHLVGNDFILTAHIDYQLSDRAKEALQNGVALFWTYQFKVEKQRSYWLDKTVVDKRVRYRLQYHALMKMYRVTNESNGAVENYTSLEAALDELATLDNYRLIEKAEVAANRNYTASMKINFEQDALPLPLRPVAYMNPQWYLSSDWYSWPLK